MHGMNRSHTKYELDILSGACILSARHVYRSEGDTMTREAKRLAAAALAREADLAAILALLRQPSAFQFGK